MNAVRPSVRVRRPGALTTIQDCGRAGYAHLGVPRSGALDAPAHHRANQLVGNPPGAAVLETTLTGVAVIAEAAMTAAVTGARAAVRVDGEPAALDGAIALRPGQLLDVGPARPGVRSYVAFSGGLAPPLVLGSAATDLLSGIGPDRLAAGDVLPLGGPGAPPRRGCTLPGAVELADAAPPDGQAKLLIHLGPRQDWLSAAGLDALRDGSWTVSPHSNRVALRLGGTPVPRSRLGELASEGLVTGAIQALPDGQLVVFLADHPTTGGYPVVAVLDPASLPACAQARPGMTIRFLIA
jgi:biotin-dependent carboxylase-like uncharacterized protein